MKFLLGSNFWKMNTETSDLDLMEYRFPTKTEMFKGEFLNKQLKDNNGNDLVLKDVRLLLKELKKGSLRTFEVLYSNPLEMTDSRSHELWSFLSKNRDQLFEELKPRLYKACYGELNQRVKSLNNGLSTKTLSHCFKLDYVLSNENPFQLWFKDKRYEEALYVRNTNNNDFKNKLHEEYKNRLKFYSTQKYNSQLPTPTLDELEKLLLKLCFDL